jgi:hypothetical protein
MARDSQVVRLKRGLYTYRETGTQPDTVTHFGSELDSPPEVGLGSGDEPDEAESVVSARPEFRGSKPKKLVTETSIGV